MSAIGTAQHAKALALAHLNTTALTNAMLAVAKAKDEFSGAPIKLMVAMLSEIPEETLDGLPRIGSKPSETDNPDLFPWKDPSSDGKEKEVSFYVVWSDNTTEGAKVVEELGWLSCLNDPDKKTDHIPADYKAKYGSNPEQRKQRKKYLEGRRGTIRSSYKKAVQLMHQFDAINELAGVHATTIPGVEEGTFENVILVRSKVPGRETLDYEHYTVGQFLKLNAAKAAEQGGSLTALKATVTRDGKKQKQEPGVPALASIQTPETMDKVMTAVHSYLDGIYSNKKGMEYAALLKFLTGPNGASAVETLGDIKGILDDLFRMDKIAFIYSKIADGHANNTDGAVKAA
jgi:hypothetical protein